MIEIEKKLKLQNHKHEQDLRLIEETFTEKINILNQKIYKYEGILKNSNQSNTNKPKNDPNLSQLSQINSSRQKLNDPDKSVYIY